MNDFVIKVKTKWNKTNNNYERKIISYKYTGSSNKMEFVPNFLDVFNIETQYKKHINNNTLEIDIYDQNDNIIINKNDLMNDLLKFTKIQWNYED